MDLVTMQTAAFTFQYYRNMPAKAFNNYLTFMSSKHNYNTRLASKSTYIDQVRTSYGKFNIHYFSGPSIWNNLDEEIKGLSLRLFKQT